MSDHSDFPPTPQAARERLAAAQPDAYARTRNALDGAVTRVSPYLTHGFVTLPEVLAEIASRHRLDVQHKFVFELGWREYFQHVWARRGDAILDSLHAGPLPDDAFARELPPDLREGRTGVPVIDQAVRTLYATGYLHNHARMWLASYAVHLRKLHWRAGADWMFGHLLDGDLASNHLSWQWVAGTASSKPYLFNADNVERYAPAAWHSRGSVVDVSYDTLERIARTPGAVGLPPVGRTEDGVAEPALSSEPPPALAGRWAEPAAAAEALRGRDVWLVHPWLLGDPPADLPAGTCRVAVWPGALLGGRPWSGRRHGFVGARMAALADVALHGDAGAIAHALAGARSVQTRDDRHLAAALHAWSGRLPGLQVRPAPRLFPAVDHACDSFSQWWNRCTRGLREPASLPGLAAGVAAGVLPAPLPAPPLPPAAAVATVPSASALSAPSSASPSTPSSSTGPWPAGAPHVHTDPRAGDRRPRWHRS